MSAKKVTQYETAKAFRTALETRINSTHKANGTPIGRIRKQISFDRLLARLFAQKPSPWLLKGGYAMQLRLVNSRATKDIDLAMRDFKPTGGADIGIELLGYLQQQITGNAVEDYFEFRISGPIFDIEAAPYGGARYLVEARVDDRTFEKFHLDIGIGDVWMDQIDQLKSNSWLSFAGFTDEVYPAVPREQQFAEKLHAYTVPRGAGINNTRVKDLVDMVLLVTSGALDRDRLIQAIDATFKWRGTHSFDANLIAQGSDWNGPFARLASECGLSPDIAAGFKLVQEFARTLSP